MEARSTSFLDAMSLLRWIASHEADADRLSGDARLERIALLRELRVWLRAQAHATMEEARRR